jgi:hypothetical protein
MERGAGHHIAEVHCSKSESGEYVSAWVRGAWWAWQASRAALVIELPYVHGSPTNEAASDQDYYLDQAKADMRQQCKKAIERSGVKVMP